MNSVREELIYYCHKVYEKGFVSAYDGNLSLRIDEQRILITPTSKNKGELQESDLIEIDYEGNKLSGQGNVTTESKIHLLAYKIRNDINAVVHAHPIYATAFALVGKGINEPILPEVILSLGKVPLCKYGTPSTDELPDSMLPYIEFAWAMLLENHGAITFGKNIKDAYYRMEKLEHAAKTIFTARQLGTLRKLNNNDLQKLYKAAEETYGISINQKLRY